MPARTLTYFISDLHLGASYFDDPRAHERMVAQWLLSIAPTARRLYLVGDVLDYWYEYRHVVPRGHVRFFGALASLADSGVEITWMIGNHDIWIYDYLPTELGIRVVDGNLTETIDGYTFFISHGDGLGRIPRGMKLIRSLLRNRLCQRLFAAIHPRWTVGLAYAWSAHNRRKHHPAVPQAACTRALTDWLDAQPDDARPDFYIFGHYHTVMDTPVGTRSRALIIGDWITRLTYATFDGTTLALHTHTPG